VLSGLDRHQDRRGSLRESSLELFQLLLEELVVALLAGGVGAHLVVEPHRTGRGGDATFLGRCEDEGHRELGRGRALRGLNSRSAEV
jgi:hypothetical protein